MEKLFIYVLAESTLSFKALNVWIPLHWYLYSEQLKVGSSLCLQRIVKQPQVNIIFPIPFQISNIKLEIDSFKMERKKFICQEVMFSHCCNVLSHSKVPFLLLFLSFI